MGFMPFALSLHSLVSSVGADAGFAALVGLAILVLLYFAHARETTNLREEAAVLSERLQQAEAKLAQVRRGQPVAQAAPAQAARDQAAVVPPPAQAPIGAPGARPAPATAAGAVTAQAVPAAPAGLAAPALAAATRFLPQPEVAQSAAPIQAPAQPEPAEPEPAVAALRQPVPSAAPAEPRSGALSAPAPATAAGAANGARERAEPAMGPPPPVERAAPSRRASGRPVPPRAAARSRMLPPQPPPRRSSGMARRVSALVAALVVVGVVAGLLIATSGGGSSQPQASPSPASNAPSAAPAPATPAFNPASVTVAVLNGTSTNNLAHKVGSQLTAAGYKQGMVATASDQTHTKTVVAYLPGNRNDAVHVASSLKLGASAVTPVDSSTQAIACPPPNPCSVQVIVTVGSDLATL